MTRLATLCSLDHFMVDGERSTCTSTSELQAVTDLSGQIQGAQSCSVLSEVLFGWVVKKMCDKYLEQRPNLKIYSGLEPLNRVITEDEGAFNLSF